MANRNAGHFGFLPLNWILAISSPIRSTISENRLISSMIAVAAGSFVMRPIETGLSLSSCTSWKPAALTRSILAR